MSDKNLGGGRLTTLSADQLAHGAIATSLVLSLALLGSVWWASGRGYDFTDEGFYWLWMHDPFAFDASLSQFGFVYHPLYSAFDGDIANIRRANALITWGLAGAMLFATVVRVSGRWSALDAALALA